MRRQDVIEGRENGRAPPPYIFSKASQGRNRTMAGPLDGIRIIDVTTVLLGPYGTQMLGDLGADVIKLEPPAGDISRPIGRTYFYNVNFNKRCVCFDASKPGAKDAIQRLAASLRRSVCVISGCCSLISGSSDLTNML